jgi:phosphoserine aminotransferase
MTDDFWFSNVIGQLYLLLIKIVAPESESDYEMSVQGICAPQKNPKKKTTINTLDVSAEEMDYQKNLKWLKDHGELTGEEGNNPGDGNDSA